MHFSLKMKIEFVDLRRQLYGDLHNNLPGIIGEIQEAVAHCAKESSFIMGAPLEQFEKEFAAYCGARYCVGLNSGTDALEFALRCNGVQQGEVITAPNSYFSTASAISQVGATPRFVDIDRRTFNLDASKLEDAVNESTKAIIPVHLYGRPAPMDAILYIAKKYRLKIIEDCCQAHGSRFNQQPVPVSKTGAFSFYPAKNIGCWGDGGALVTDDPEGARQAFLWRNDGSLERYHHEIIGRKARLDTLQAAILSVKLKYLNKWNELRREGAALYTQLLEEVEELQLPLLGDEKIEPVFHIYPIITEERDNLGKYLAERGVSTNIHYPTPIHLQPAYKHLGLPQGSFPVAEDIAKKTLSLPMFPEIRKEEIEYVCRSIKEFFHLH